MFDSLALLEDVIYLSSAFGIGRLLILLHKFHSLAGQFSELNDHFPLRAKIIGSLYLLK